MTQQINNRIFELRKSLNLSQEKFAYQIGLTKSGVSNMESGSRNLTESNFKLICATFNVSEDWLRDGNGEMFALKDMDDELAWLVGQLHAQDDLFMKRLITEILKLDSRQKDAIKKFVTTLATTEE